MTTTLDLAVIGLGAMGAATTWRAAVKGGTVLGLDRFGPAHDRGSSHGGSRIFRRTLFEGVEYVPLVDRSQALWEQLDAAHGGTLFRRSGGLCIGPAEGELIRDALEAMAAGDVEHEMLDHDALTRRFPQHRVEPDEVGIFEPGAGVLDPERCIRAMLTAAVAAGADVRHETLVDRIDVDGDRVLITSGDRTWTARRVVVATGAWFTDLVPQLQLPLRVQRSPLVWFRGERPEEFLPDRFPTFIHESTAVDGWGIPDVDGNGVKVGAGATAPKPWLDHADDNFAQISAVDTAPAEAFVRQGLTGVDPRAASARACMNSKTPDSDFVLGVPKQAPALVLAGGFSGHGFKHAAGVGDVCAALALDGASDIDLTRFDPDRFEERTA